MSQPKEPQPSPLPAYEPEPGLNAAPPDETPLSVDEYLNVFETDSKPSADTVVNEETGDMEPPAVAEGGPASMPLSVPESLKETETLIKMRETAQAMGLAWYADGDISAWEQYQYEDWQRKLLVEAWAPLVADMGLRVGNNTKVIYAEILSTGPLLRTMFNNRKMRLELEAAKALIAQQNAQITKLEGNQAAPRPQQKKEVRPDAKKWWTVKSDGTFYYNRAGVYAKAGEEQERPDLTPENYALLCKYNGKDRIDKIYKIPA